MTQAIHSDTRLNIIERKVKLTGMTDIMFDRYPGDNGTQLAWEQKVYLDGQTLVLPVANIVSFLSAHNTNSAPKRLRDVRKYKAIANACLSFVMIEALDGNKNRIPFTREGDPIIMGDIENDQLDPKSGLYLHRSVARLEKGIPNPKERPVLPHPWELEFILKIYPNKEIKEDEIKNLSIDGGIAIGLGTYRGLYGKFEVTCWN